MEKLGCKGRHFREKQRDSGEAAGMLVMCLELGDHSGLLCRVVMTRLKEAWTSACPAETFKMPTKKWRAIDGV